MTIRGAQVQEVYYRFQAVEVRNTHNGRETWRPAKIHRRTSRGCEVIYNEGPQAPQHIMYPDLRPMEKAPREAVKVSTPLLSPADIDRINAQIEAEARQKSEAQAANKPEPAPQNLVLVKRPDSAPPPQAPIPIGGRRKRVPKQHTPTPLSEALRKARIAKGLQQKDAARLAKLAVPTRLTTYESGDVAPIDDDLLGLSIALDLDLDHLLELRDGPKAPAANVVVTNLERFPDPEPEEDEPAPEPEIRAHFAAPDVARMRHEITELRNENTTLRAARARGELAGGSHELAQLREENEVLRRAVVFYTGRES